MPTQLIICIDRDNDLGVKTGISTPVIGRKENLEAATKLALKDPTEADANTIFGAINLYDELYSKGADVEIVSIAGDPLVGIVSDRKIARQVEDVLKKLSPERCIVVTDGADDEFILPIIHSRIKVDYVKRVVVVQSQALESAYYQIKKALSDPKFAKVVFVPLGLMFLIYGILWAAGNPSAALIGILLFLGIYFLARGFGWSEALGDFARTVEKSFYEGHFSFITYIIALLVLILGTIVGVTEVLDLYTVRENYIILIHSGLPVWLLLFSEYLYNSIGWYTGTVSLILVGRFIDKLAEKEVSWKTIPRIFFLISAGLVLWGSSGYILSIGTVVPTHQFVALRILLYCIVAAIIISVLGIWMGKQR
jgi:putative membrane protein